MPVFSVKLSDGRTVRLEADQDPTEDEVLAAVGDVDSPQPQTDIGGSFMFPPPESGFGREAVDLAPPSQFQDPGLLSSAAPLAAGIETGLNTPEKMIRSGLDLVGWYPLLDKLTGSGTKFQDYNKGWMDYFANREEQLQRENEALGQTGFVPELLQGAAKAAVELPVQLMGGVGAATPKAAVAGSSLMAGAMGGLGEYGQERQEGKGRLEAAAKGATSGAITAVTTRAFGATGIESIFKKEGVAGLRNRIAETLKQMGYEGFEEAADQFQQDLLERATKNPEKPIEQTVHDVLLAGSIGTVLGGGVSAATQGVNAAREASINQQIERTQNALQPESAPIPGNVQQPEVAQESAQQVPAAEGSTQAIEARVEVQPEISKFVEDYEALTPQTTEQAVEVGKTAKGVEDLQVLLDASTRVRQRASDERAAAKTETDQDKKLKIIMGLGKYGGVQYPREAIEYATSIGSHVNENAPLDFKKNPEVAQWLRTNADKIWSGENLKNRIEELDSVLAQSPTITSTQNEEETQEEVLTPEPVGAIASSVPLATTAPAPTALQPKAQRQIIADLSKGLNIPIRFGRLTTRKFAGYFMPVANLIGSKKAVDIPTVSHEAGHKLDQAFKLSSDRTIASELDVLGDPATPGSSSSWTKSKSKSYKMGEGVAEFVRYWMTDPPKALSMAPNTHRLWEAALDSNKDFGDVMRQARDDIQTWRNSEPQARLRSQIVSGNPNKTKYTGSQLIRDLVDDLHILRLATEHGAKTSPLDPSKNAYLLARNLRGSYGMADTFVRNGVTDFNTKDVKLGTSLSDALKPVAGRLNDFRDWIVAKRAQELISQGRETGLVKSDVDAVAAKFDGDADFQKAFADVKAWNDALLQYAVDAGFVTPESADAMRKMNQDYVPFHRVFEVGAGESPSQQSTGTGMGLNVGKPGSFKKLKGSTRAIADPLETMVQNAYTLITASEKAAINRAVAEMANLPDMGRWVERVAAPNEAVRVTADKIRKELEAAGADMTAVPDDLIVTFFRQGSTAPFGENIIRVIRNGKQEFYRLNRDLHDTFKALDLEDTGTLIRILAAPAQLLRSGVVLEPSFNVANVIRDTFSSAVIGKYGAFPFQTTFNGVAAMLTKPKAIAEWAASGGKNSVESVYFDRSKLKKFLAERISKDLSPAERALIVAKSPLTALRYLTSVFEEATRVGEYQIAFNKLTKSGMPEGEARRLAAFESRDRQDFAKGGAKTKIVRHLAAFWNAALQANVKLLQSFKQRPVRTTLQGLAFITIPKLLEQALNWDDDDYWERPQWERDLFFLIPIGKDETGHTRFLRLPTPFEVGIIFGTFPGRIMEWMKTNRPDAMEGFPQLMLKNSVPNPIPQSGQMIFEDFLSGKQGWDVYRGRTIVPDALKDLPPDLQYNEQTSRIAKEIGSRLGYSPMKVDHIIESTTGGIGKLATGRSDPFSRFVTRPLRVSNQSTEDFYVRLEEMRMQAARSKLTGEGDIPDDLKAYERTAKTLSELRRELRETTSEKERAGLQKEMFDLISETVKQ